MEGYTVSDTEVDPELALVATLVQEYMIPPAAAQGLGAIIPTYSGM